MPDSKKPQINAREVFGLYINQQYDRLSEKFLEILRHFETTTYFQLANDARYFINMFVKLFLDIFTQPDYTISPQHGIQFVQLNAVISNLVAISHFKNTDPYLELLKNQPHNVYKFLSLYSVRNSVDVDKKILFNANQQFACLWYSFFFDLYRPCLAEKYTSENFQRHLYFTDERIKEYHNISAIYFGSTYIDGEGDRALKEKINQAIQTSAFCTSANIENTPNHHKIAIISSLWFKGHSVHRTLSKYVESLQQDYELTLVHLGPTRNNTDISSFREVKYVAGLNIEAIRRNDFIAIYYPDIGMSTESIFLSNLRLAPIQICGTGHPVSTFGSQIDYFISGQDVENPADVVSKYSERVILLPGLGAIHEHPTYQLKNPPKPTSPFIINCPWFAQKINYQMVCVLREIIERSPQEILLRFFCGNSLMAKNDFLPFAQSLESVLPANSFDVVPGKVYDEYMAVMEEGEICLEPHHFGGSNIIADSLYLRKPTITLEGGRWYNRIGSQMLRLVGLSELVCTTKEDYINLTLKLIGDRAYRHQIQEKLNQADLGQTIFNSECQHYFKQAIDFIIQNRDRLQNEDSKQPIIINRS